MTHRFPVKEIALQSGVSTATVDRVLNQRRNVSPQTIRRVQGAIEELKRQETQLAAKGRRFFIDIIVEAPSRFSRKIQLASETVLTDFKPTAIRPRFTLSETMSVEDCVGVLERIGKRGSQGVCLKARDTREIRVAISNLMRKSIPVVTIFTDVTGSNRLAYAGLNNFAAGQTAAYLMQELLDGSAKTVLTTLSQHVFQGEEDRYQGFLSELSCLRPDLSVIDASGGSGLNPSTGREIADKVPKHIKVDGVYSMGGGNQAALEVLSEIQKTLPVYIAHDLDEDNLDLLQNQKLTFVLHHDLKADMRAAFRQILAFHGIGDKPTSSQSDIHIVTPKNIPADLA
ncbi:MAG: LacI family DNA-binding transcriptional regulator [Roseibium sp.]